MAQDEEMTIKKEGAHIENVEPEDGDISKQANKATEFEHDQTTWQALKQNWKAVLWSMFISLSIIMDGYDGSTLGNFVAFPAFQKRYGVQHGDSYVISTPWQIAMGLSTPIGRLVGGPIAGWCVERFGRKRTMTCALFFIIGFIFILFFSASLEVFFTGEMLISCIWGVFNTIAPTYASEVAPVALRGLVTMYIQLCWGIGTLLAVGVLKGLESREDQWAFRIAFAIQWVWPVLLLAGMYWVPESPWWYVRRGMYDDAKKSLSRLTSCDDDQLDETMAMYVRTDQFEQESNTKGSYLDCFKGTNLRRTEICCMVWAIQSLCGSNVGGSFFFEQAGLSSSASFDLTLGQAGLSVFAEILAMVCIPKIGRRAFYNWGLLGMTILMLVMGTMSFSPKSIAYPQAGLMLAWQFLYHFTIGPTNYVIIGEISATKLRGQTISIGLCAYSLCIIVLSVLTPYMLNPTSWDWKGKTCLFYFGICVFCMLWAYFRLPETKGRTYEELDHLFEKKVPARKFGKYKLELAELAY